MAIAARGLGVDAFVPTGRRVPAPSRPDGAAAREDEQKPSIAKDVAKIRIWPGADQPAVSTSTDPRLANSGMTATILSFLDKHIALPVAEIGRWVTRTVGPGMFWVSGALNGYYLAKNWKDPRFSIPMKATMAAGTASTAAAAATSTWAALPLKGALTANRFSGLFGGVAGGIFSAINMVITLKNKKATPVEKTMATAGFATGIAGTAFGTLAAFLPAGAALGPLGLGAWGVAFGLTCLGLGLAQMWLGKNKTLNKAFGAVGKPFGKVWDKVSSFF